MDHSPIHYQAPINSTAFRKISSKASGKRLIFGASNDGFVSDFLMGKPWFCLPMIPRDWGKAERRGRKGKGANKQI
jgi:hypothetical protein